MKIKEGFILRRIAGEKVVVPVGEMMVSFNRILSLSDTGAFIWQLLADNDLTKDEILEHMLDEYEVDKQSAARDIDRFIASLQAADLLA